VRLLTGALLVLVMLAGLARTAAAITPSERLNEARTMFRAGQYRDAIPLLAGLLYPAVKLSEATDLAEAHLLLGLSYFEVGQQEDAERELEEALALEPDLRIDKASGIYSREAVEFFDRKRKELERRAIEEAAARERARLRMALKNTPAVEKNQYWLNFVPFGVGQLQNGQRKKAVFFFASQAGLAAASFGLWFYQRSEYPTGQVPVDEVGTVRRLQVLQIGAAAGFYLLWGAGVVDAIANYEPAVRRQLTDEEIEQLMQDEPPPASSFRIVPTIFEGGAGAALSWEF
jgi:tetratricopeptide (TPR) repeat protein